jgi:hypothetical protein
MPFYLKENIDVISEVDKFKSVLIVPCRFCPAASLALTNKEPYIALLSNFLKTASYEQLLKIMKFNFEKKGIKTGVFRSKIIHQFVLCMWSTKRREKLKEIAKEYEAIVVMGCDAAIETVKDAVKSTSCQVIPGMTCEGVMSIRMGFHMPCNISLELDSVTPITPILQEARDSETVVSL